MKKAKIKHHIWGLVVLLVYWLAVMTGCGLPQYTFLEKPVRLYNSDTVSSTILGFTTPSDDTGITGYTLYYKIYISTDDYINQDDEKYFDEGYYVDAENELQPGSAVPKARGFVLAGNLDETNLPTSRYTIPHTAANDNILLDFNRYGVSNSNDWAEPIVGVGPLPIGSIITTLARGFIDYRDSNNKLRRFVDDWYFQPDFTDGDLRRPPGKQPGTSSSDLTGTPLTLDTPSHTRLIISFVVHSTGLDPTILSPVDSQPVFLGSIEYTNISNTPDRDI